MTVEMLPNRSIGQTILSQIVRRDAGCALCTTENQRFA